MYIVTSRSLATEIGIDRAKAFESLSGLREEFRSAGNQEGDRQSAREKANEMLAEGLSDEQKEKWKKIEPKPAS
jgi:hypothetical protein